jgi:CubicO group peptidase (beta-lactamase class C family)
MAGMEAVADSDMWGASAGFPTGWGSPPGMSRNKETRVGNYSGGFESMLPFRTVQCGAESALRERPRADIRYRWGLGSRTVDDYLSKWPVTGLLIARGGEVWSESYRFARNADMRMTGWSMSKSVTSLLLGISLDRGYIGSLEDPAAKYVPTLAGTLHGETTLRNLMNMSSGAAIVHDVGNRTIYPSALASRSSSIEATVRAWNERGEAQGVRFNYNELCPLTIGMVIRAASAKSLSELAQEALWQPMGAEANATWLTDSHRNEFNCIGFAARLRDWARLGQLVAQRGEMNGRQIVSRVWMESYSRWETNEAQVRYGAWGLRQGALLNGYKGFMWHAKADGSQPVFNGAEAQRVFIDLPTQTVLVQTAVDQDGDWQRELYALFTAVVDMA